MTTEVRLRRQARFYNFMVSWYSFWTIVASLIELTGKYSLMYSNIVLAVFAVGIFSVSLYILGERYSDRAEQIKNCYLELQALYNGVINTDDKMKRYADILRKYENQTDDDYDEMMFDAFLRNQSLENSYGPIKISKIIFAKVLCKRIYRSCIYMLFTAFPIVCLGYAIRLVPNS